MIEVKLVQETLIGKLSSFEKLVKLYEKKIFSHTYSILKNIHDAQDATQVTFIKVYENLKSYDMTKPFNSWIYKIATNYCYDMISKNKRLVKLEAAYEVEDTQESILERIVRDERIEAVKRALLKLPDIYRQPLIGQYYGGLDYLTLSKNFNLPVNTLRTRLKRGKTMLAKSFNEEY